jgi:hypothetical protein
MKMPGFTADASLYGTSGRYRVSASEFGALQSWQSIVPAYRPSTETMKQCTKCQTACGVSLAFCEAGAVPACVTPITCAAALGVCSLEYLGCLVKCTLPVVGDCCPKPCRFPDPLNPGIGCCDEGENCVDESDPNSRSGCCPSDQNVCGGKCCSKGDTCCGSECCPPGWFCSDGVCSQSVPFPGGTPPEPPKPSPGSGVFDVCPPMWTHCKDKCCRPGLECCIKAGGATTCQTRCVG